MPDKVSILIPVYNAEAYLERSIKSALEQSHTNTELIVVDDGSTDKSYPILKDLTSAHSKITLIRQENQGQSAALNTAISKASGNYIKFFDADDVMNRDHLKLQLAQIQGFPEHVASCEWGRFYDGNPDSARFDPEEVWKDLDSLDWIKTAMNQDSDMMGAWVWLIPRKLLDRTGGWNEELSLNNDFEFSIRLLLQAKKVCFTPGAKLYYRSGVPNSLSTKLSREKILAAIETTDLGCAHLLKAEDSPLIHRLCADRYQDWVYRIYPKYPDLVRMLEKKISRLGGSTKKALGGKAFETMARFLGWKMAKRIQLLAYSVGYTPKHPHQAKA